MTVFLCWSFHSEIGMDVGKRSPNSSLWMWVFNSSTFTISPTPLCRRSTISAIAAAALPTRVHSSAPPEPRATSQPCRPAKGMELDCSQLKQCKHIITTFLIQLGVDFSLQIQYSISISENNHQCGLVCGQSDKSACYVGIASKER